MTRYQAKTTKDQTDILGSEMGLSEQESQRAYERTIRNQITTILNGDDFPTEPVESTIIRELHKHKQKISSF